jgi:hypothetical protein
MVKTSKFLPTLPYVSSLADAFIARDGRFGAQAPVSAING